MLLQLFENYITVLKGIKLVDTIIVLVLGSLIQSYHLNAVGKSVAMGGGAECQSWLHLCPRGDT